MRIFIGLALLCLNLCLSSSLQAGIFHGVDSRYESRLETTQEWSELSKSALALIHLSNMEKIEGGWFLTGRSLQDVGMCEDILFGDQKLIANCSASLVASDIVLTAAHCLNHPDNFSETSRFNCQNYAFVFDYSKKNDGSDPYFIPEENVFFCDEVLYHEFDTRYFTEDISYIRLDRKVEGRTPVDLSFSMPREGDELAMIGHPFGIFQKYMDGGFVTELFKDKQTFRAELDAYSVNSGGPIFDPYTMKQVGVLVRGSSSNMTMREGDSCYDWGIAREDDFTEGNFLTIPRACRNFDSLDRSIDSSHFCHIFY